MKSERWIIGVVAYCQDCDAAFEWYGNAREKALKHARKHKHLVTGETTWYWEHNGRKEKKT